MSERACARRERNSHREKQMNGGFGVGTLNMLILLAVVVIVMLGYC
jgi:hypothetical protein